MQSMPDTPPLVDAEPLTGHLWVQELPTGGQFRFQVANSGRLTFGTADRTFDTVEAVPLSHRRTAMTVSERLNRGALRTALDDPTQITFFGTATRNEGISYNWMALPPFVGIDVWSDTQDGLLAPDAATTVYERLNLPTLPAITKEAPADHTDLTQYEDGTGFPPSAWRDGAAAGILIRDKTGGRAQVCRVDVTDSIPASPPDTATDLAAQYATSDRIERTVAALRDRGHTPTVDAIRDQLVADVAREVYTNLYHDDDFVVSPDAFHAAVGERVQKHRHNQ